MNPVKTPLVLAVVLWKACLLQADPAPTQGVPPPADPSGGAPAEAADAGARADARFEEMLSKMQASVEEIAGLYGNPLFLQVFTNDPQKADELKMRLKAYRKGEELERENAALEKRRSELLGDLALKQRESSRLAARLVRQRAALDALAAALEAARRAAEDSAN